MARMNDSKESRVEGRTVPDLFDQYGKLAVMYHETMTSMANAGVAMALAGTVAHVELARQTLITLREQK